MDNGGAFEDARIAIAQACARHGVTAGIHGNAALAAKHVAAGYRLVTVHSDIAAIATAAAADLRLARGGGGG
jgi:2-keto-3-deoxy-L-rhamnonate aldolase RhmA